MNGKTVLITGACGDIGRSLAAEFARLGARLALCDVLSEKKARAAWRELRHAGAEFHYGSVDVADAAALKRFVARATRVLGAPDVCIANAGIVERGALLELSPEAWRRTLEVNLTGAFLTAQAAGRAMVAGQREGRIIFISSWTQDHPRAGIGAYCASKGGMKMLAKCLALELAPHGIRVNLVAPGWVDAGLTAHNLRAHPELAEEIRSQIPLGRLVSGAELAAAVRLLCSEDADYLTGTTLLVDGGSSLCYRKPRGG